MANLSRDGSSLTQRTLAGIAWLLSGAVARTVVRLALMLVLVRLITPEAFGVFAQATVMVGFALMFVELGLGEALVQRKSLEVEHERAGLWAGLLAGALVAAILVGLAPTISRFWSMPELALPLQVLCLSILPRVGLSIPQALMRREMRMKAVAVIDLASLIVGQAIPTLLLALLGYSVWALVYGAIAGSVVQLVALFVARPVSAFGRTSYDHLRQLLRYGSGITFARVANYIARYGDYLLIGWLLGAAPLGYYTRAYQLVALPADLIGRALNNVVFPAMAQVQHERARLRRGLLRALALVFLAVLPVSAPAFIVAPEAIAVMLGPQWSPSERPFQILVAVMALRAGHKVGGVVVRAVGRIRVLVAVQVLYAALVVAGAAVGTRWGTQGVAMGVGLALTIHFGLLTSLALRIVQARVGDVVRVLRPSCLLAAVVCLPALGVTYLLRNFSAPAWGVLGGSGIACMFLGLAVVRLAPRATLGEHGIWLVSRLAAAVGPRFPLHWFIGRNRGHEHQRADRTAGRVPATFTREER